jgi:diguanylate cyclase (GGDEF)-like protein
MPDLPRKAAAALAAFLLLYVSWQATHWIPGDSAKIADVFFVPIGAAAVVCCFRAAHLWQINRLRWFWALMGLAIGAQLAGDTTMLVYALGESELPFPSFADLAYLSFYPLMLLALLAVPVAPTTHPQRVRIGLDLTIALVGGGMVIWYLVGAQTLADGGQSTLQMTVAMAYPAGDLALLAGLVITLLRWSPRAVRPALSLIAVGLAMFVVADLVYSYSLLHDGYVSGGPIDTLWIAALGLFALAATTREKARTEAPKGGTPAREITEKRVSWLPFAAIAIGSLGLVRAEVTGHAQGLSLVLGTSSLALLIAIRQYVTQRQMIKLQGDLQEAHDRLAELANQDSLTSVPNRRSIEVVLADEFQRAQRHGREVSVVFVDIDHFKTVNDTWGHAAGDCVLAEFAHVLESCLRPADTLSRWGGEEFVVVLPETGALGGAATAERIRSRVEAHSFSFGEGQGLTCSIGIAGYPDDAMTPVALVDLADRGMYEAKRLGRNRVEAAPQPEPPKEPAAMSNGVGT